jgi:hypothetical protein
MFSGRYLLFYHVIVFNIILNADSLSRYLFFHFIPAEGNNFYLLSDVLTTCGDLSRPVDTEVHLSRDKATGA